MSSKLGLLLSFVFVIYMMMFGADLAMIGSVSNYVDGVAMTVSQRLAYDGAFTKSTAEYIERSGCKFWAVTGSEYSLRVGDTFVFGVGKPYTPMFMTKSEMLISATRSCVIGFYRTTS
ncbi:MAG: hypothetical protein HUJ60_03095 [Bacilli bacterium]|nr:hypothetical protein [Bacilli bacterium]